MCIYIYICVICLICGLCNSPTVSTNSKWAMVNIWIMVIHSRMGIQLHNGYIHSPLCNSMMDWLFPSLTGNYLQLWMAQIRRFSTKMPTLYALLQSLDRRAHARQKHVVPLDLLTRSVHLVEGQNVGTFGLNIGLLWIIESKWIGNVNNQSIYDIQTIPCDLVCVFC